MIRPFAGNLHVIALALEDHAHKPANGRIILNDEDG
jgi:hypothetical protein